MNEAYIPIGEDSPTWAAAGTHMHVPSIAVIETALRAAHYRVVVLEPNHYGPA